MHRAKALFSLSPLAGRGVGVKGLPRAHQPLLARGERLIVQVGGSRPLARIQTCIQTCAANDLGCRPVDTHAIAQLVSGQFANDRRRPRVLRGRSGRRARGLVFPRLFNLPCGPPPPRCCTGQSQNPNSGICLGRVGGVELWSLHSKNLGPIFFGSY
jgi:hypothetical protein